MKKPENMEIKLLNIPAPLMEWYYSHARILPWRESPEPYAVWISEIMLQQTRVEAVKPYFDRWIKSFPNLPALAAASEAEVLKLWEGLGYYSRARNIHRAAQQVMEKYAGALPSSFEELRSLPGIGEYTAGAVASIAFQVPVPCVDGNVLRVVARLAAEEADVGTQAVKKRITGWIKEIIPKDRPGDFNQAMMELGATVCLPNGKPRCEICPLAGQCQARIQERVTDFPVKSSRPARKAEKKTVLILLRSSAEQGGQVETVLRMRPDRGLLAGLWEFPTFDGELEQGEVEKIILSSFSLKAASLVTLKRVTHIFTHKEWHLTGYLAMLEAPQEPKTKTDRGAISESANTYGESEGFQWIPVEELTDRLALPAAFKTYYENMKHYIDKELQNESK